MKKKNTDRHNNISKNDNAPKKGGKGLIIALIILSILVVLIGSFVILGQILKSKISDVPVNNQGNEVVDIIENEGKEILEEVNDKEPIIEEAKESEPEIEIIKEELYDYENKLVGIKFNYATDMYIKENTDTIFNTLKAVSKEGKNFKIDKDKLVQSLNILQLTTGEADGLLITVSILPFDVANKSVAVDESNIAKERVSEIPLITEEMLIEYDSNLKKSLIELGVTIDVFEKSYVRDTNGLKAIISERKYSGGKETKTGVTDVIQGLVPVGENAILVRAITDGSPIEIDKVVLFDEIIDSLIVNLTKVVELSN